MFGQKKREAAASVAEEIELIDSTEWVVKNAFADFFVMHTKEILYMCMFGYTFFHGTKVFGNAAINSPANSLPYKFVNMVMACTGGGILVPIFINSIPVPLGIDAYPIAIVVSFLLHLYFPILREIMKESKIAKGFIIFLYETLRAGVLVKLTAAAGAAIPASQFSFPVFGPIFCGTIAGCGGAFLPLNKGLDPLKNGLAPNMLSALIAATFYHLFLNTSLSDGVMQAKKKAHVVVVVFFVIVGLSNGLSLFVGSGRKTKSIRVKTN